MEVMDEMIGVAKKFHNYKKNFCVLSAAGVQNLDNPFILSGIIYKFFIQFELGWKVLKELLIYEGVAVAKSGSPREIIKEAYRFYSCMEEPVWLDMLAQRNNMAHIYDEAAARQLADDIIDRFVPAFLALQESIESRYGKMLEEKA